MGILFLIIPTDCLSKVDSSTFPWYSGMYYITFLVPSLRHRYSDDTNEGTVFTPTNISSQQDMSQFLGDQFPFMTDTMAQRINAMYPKAGQFPNHGAYYSAAANAYGELRYICVGRFISTMVNSFGVENSWNYQ